MRNITNNDHSDKPGAGTFDISKIKAKANPEMMIMAAGGGGPMDETEIIRSLKTIARIDKFNDEENRVRGSSSEERSADSFQTDRSSVHNKKH